MVCWHLPLRTFKGGGSLFELWAAAQDLIFLIDGPENSLILLSGAAGAFARQDMLQTTPKKELANLGYPNGPLLIWASRGGQTAISQWIARCSIWLRSIEISAHLSRFFNKNIKRIFVSEVGRKLNRKLEVQVKHEFSKEGWRNCAGISPYWFFRELTIV